jgi:nucleoside-diphosphate-sugar epimerase
MKIVFTGAAGVLGVPLGHSLTQAGHEVRGVDRVPHQDSALDIEVVDLLNRDICYDLLAGADAVVHLANHSNEHLPDKQRLLNENLVMNTHVFQAASDVGVKTILFASSIQALGAGEKRGEGYVSTLSYLPVDGDIPAKPTNVYGLSKQLSEEMLRYYAREAQLNCVALRFPFLARTAEHADRFAHGVSTDRINEAWSYLSIADACSLILAILSNPLPGFRIYCPVADNNSLRQEPVRLIRRYFDNIPLQRPLETFESMFDISHISEETGWKPRDNWFSLNKGRI